MNDHRRKTFRFKLSLSHLLVLVYLLLLSGLFALLNVENEHQDTAFMLSHAEAVDGDGDKVSVAIYGERLRNDDRAVFAESPVEESLHLWKLLSGTSVKAIDVNEKLALAACFQKKLVSVDLSSSGGPSLSGSLDFPETIKHIRVNGERALVSMTDGGGIAIVDLSDPENMRITHQYPFAGTIVKMAASGHYIYYLDYSQGLGFVDMAANTPAPELIAELEKPWRIAIHGNRLAVADIAGNVTFFELQSNGRPASVGAIKIQDADKGGVRGLEFTSGSLVVALRGKTLSVLPLSDWPELKRTSGLALPGEPFHLVKIPGRESLLVGLVYAGMAKVDLLLSGDPVLKGHLALPTTMLALDVDDKTIYASGQGNYEGLQAFQIDEIDRKIDFGQYLDYEQHLLYSWNGQIYGYRRDKTLVDFEMSGVAQESMTGPFLFAGDNDGVGVYERSDDSGALRLGTIIMPDRAIDMLQLDDSWFVLHGRGVTVFRGRRPEALAVVGEVEIPGRPTCMKTLSPGHLIVATQKDGVSVVDVTDLSAPAIVAKLQPPRHLQSGSIARNIFVNGQRAYVSQGSGGVYIIDISRPDKPQLLQIVDTPGTAREMLVHNDLLMIADGDMGVFLVDITDGKKALPVGSLPTVLSVKEIAAVTDGIIVSSHPAGTMKIPLPQKLENFRLINSGEMLGEVSDSKLKGYAYLYNENKRSRVRLGIN